MIAYAKYFIDTTGDGDLAFLAGAEYVIGAAEHDLSVQRGTSKLGLIDEVGSMYRIGGIDYDKFIKCLKNDPGRFGIQSFGLMGKDEFIESYERGDAIIARAVYKYTTFGTWCQVYNYPRNGIMIGCVCYSERKMNCVNADELSESEYIVLKDADLFFDIIKKEFPGFENAYILDVPQTGVRETRHIMGEYLLNIVDLLNKVEFPDTIGFTSHPVDIEPKPVEHINRERSKRDSYNIPYRCLVAKGIDNLLLGGRLISATREASGCTRVTTCCMITGEAAGTASAILSKCGGKAKDIDINELRKTLKTNGVKC